MARGSPIEWLQRPGTKPASWNPTRGCRRKNDDCVNCYAEIMAARFSKPGQWGHELAEIVTLPDGSKDHRWTGKSVLAPGALHAPLTWRAPHTIFADSTADLYYEGNPDWWIWRSLAVVALTRQHTYIVLTKRPERQRDILNDPDLGDHVAAAVFDLDISRDSMEDWNRHFDPDRDLPLPNLWTGASAGTQEHAEAMVPPLLETRSALRLLSAEPLRGEIDLGAIVRRALIDGRIYPDGKTHPLGWVIAGGESGPGARPCHPDWARSLRDQCAAASVPFFWKQWGEWAPAEEHWPQPAPGDPYGEFDVGAFRPGLITDGGGLWRVGKKAAGALLDGREHREFPE